LAEVDAELEDLVSVLGIGEFRAGTPQRVKLNERISSLATRQAELSAEVEKPAGWTWASTGEKFGDWWECQDTEARNVWLRSMGIKLTFENPHGSAQLHVDLGDLKRFGEHLRFGASATEAVRRLIAGE
jgi:site-specific DNA recombinase